MQSINVKTFGARGDGVADDAAAIQAAIDRSPFGSSIWFPPGDYLVSKTIAVSKPSIRLSGSNGGAFRASKFGEVPAATGRSSSNLIGTTPGMVVLQCDGVGNLGTDTEQAGPAISDLSIWDAGGMKTGSPGTMTLVNLRNVNRWSLRNVGMFWGDVGARLQKGASGDNAGWVVDQSFVMGCNVGGLIDTFSGHWANGWVSLCGTGLAFDMTELVRPSSMRVSAVKFDILDPSTDETYKPGIGLRVGTIGTLLIDSCVFENQPGALAAPGTTAILIDPIDSQSTCVTVRDCVTVDNDFGIDCRKARSLDVRGFIRRLSNAATGGTSPIRIRSAAQLAIAPIVLL